MPPLGGATWFADEAWFSYCNRRGHLWQPGLGGDFNLSLYRLNETKNSPGVVGLGEVVFCSSKGEKREGGVSGGR